MSNRQKPRFSNDELYEMIEEFRKDLKSFRDEFQELIREMSKTSTLIRDYNDLRRDLMNLMRDVAVLKSHEKDWDKAEDYVGELRERTASTKSESDASHKYKGYIIGGIGVLIALISLFYTLLNKGG